MANDKVDTRVVEMQFDNRQFEKNVKQTSKSLDNLKQSLDFKGVGNSIDEVRLKISALQIAATAFIANIATKITNLGMTMLKSLSVDNISAGWSKFGEKTTSVATMMAQKIRIAGQEITDLAEKTAVVNEQLDLLNWFSDETSYSFNDMVSNVGKFTAAGQDLDKSVKAMEGIATWAALSGQNAQTASMAMYQLAQALSAGTVKLQDWKSIQNANMDTEEFRDNVLETAVALGQLTKEGDQFVTKTGKKFTKAQFTTQLSEGWFSSDVLIQSLGKYSAAIEDIYEIAQREGLTASEVVEKYGDQLDAFGVKAFKAAQEARTFADVLSSVKDAVSSKWMQTFEHVFGTQEEAVKLWTDLANELYDVFAESGNFRNDILAVWKELGGREDLFARGGDSQGAFWNIYDAIIAVRDLIKSAWNTVFPLTEMEEYSDKANDIGRKLKNLTARIKEFTSQFKGTTALTMRLSKILEGIFTVVKITVNALRTTRYILDPIVELAKQLVGQVLDRMSYFGSKIISTTSLIEKIAIKLHDILQGFIDELGLPEFLEEIFDTIEGIFTTISDASPISKVVELVKNFVKAFKDAVKDGDLLNSVVKLLKTTFSVLFKVLSGAIKIISAILPIVFNILSAIGNVAGSLSGTLFKTLGSIVDFFTTLMTFIKDSGIIENLVNTITKAISKLDKVLTPLLTFILKAGSILVTIVSKTIELIGNVISSFTEKVNSGGLLTTIGGLLGGLISVVSDFLFDSKTLGFDSQSNSSLFTAIKSLLAGIVEVIKSTIPIMNVMLTVLGKLLQQFGKLLAAFIASITLAFSNKDSSAIMSFIIRIGLLLLTLFIIYKLLTGVGGALADLKYVLEYIQELARSVTQYFKAKIFKQIAEAMLYAAAAIMLLATVDDKAMVDALATLVILMGIMLGTFALMNAMTADVKASAMGKSLRVLAAFKSISWALVIASAALTTIAKIDVAAQDKALRTIFTLLMSFTLVIHQLQSFESAKKAKTGAKVITSLSFSMVIMAYALKTIANQPWLGMVVGLGALMTSLYSFALVTWFLSKKVGSSAARAKNAVSLISSMAGSMLTMAIALRILTQQPWLGIAVGTGALLVSLFAFTAVIEYLSKSTGKNEAKVKNAIKLMHSITSGMLTMAIALRILTQQPWSGIAAATGAIITTLVAFALVIEYLSKSTGKNDAKVGNAIKLMNNIAGNMFKMAIALRILTSWNWIGIAMATGAIITTLAAFALVIEYLSKSTGKNADKVKNSIKMMNAISNSMLIMAIALRILTKQPWSGIATATGAIIASLIAMSLVITYLTKSVGKNPKKVGAAIKMLLTISVSMLLVAKALSIVSGIPWDGILKSIGIMMASIVAIVGGVLILNKISGMTDISITFLKLAGAMIILSVALYSMANGFKAFNDVEFTSILKGIIGFAGALLVLGVVSKIVEGTAVGVIFKVAASLLLIGVGLLAAGYALSTFGEGLGKVATYIVPILEALTVTLTNLVIQIVEGLVAALPQIIQALGPVLQSLTELLPYVFEIIKVLISGIINILREEGPVIITTIIELLDHLLKTLDEHIESIANSIFSILKKILQRLAANIEEIGQSLIDIVLGLVNVLTKNIGPLTVAVLNFLIEATKALFENIGPLIDIVTDYVFDFIAKVTVVITRKTIALAAMLTKVILIVLAAALRMTIASLGALSKLFITFVAALLLVIVHSFMGLTNVLLEVFKVIIKESLRVLVEAIIWAQDVFVAIGKMMLSLILRGIINTMLAVGGWLLDVIDTIFGTDLKGKLQGVADNLADEARAMVNNIAAGTGYVEDAIKNASNNINGVIQMTSNMANEAVQDGMDQIGDVVTDSVSQLGDTLTEFANDAGSNLYQGLASDDNLDGAYDAGSDMADSTSEGFADEAGIHSPSKVFAQFGKYLISGLNQGIQNGSAETQNVMADVIGDSLALATDILEGQEGDDYTIKVGMDISSVESQSARIQELMSGVNDPSLTASGRNASYNGKTLSKNNSKGSETVNEDNSTTVTYNNTFNIESTDPQQSADEIDKVLKQQNNRFKLAHGT